ncbi:YaaC family protein [Nocardiopsis changdeensis]|uniref:YaaC-like Protein n=1 Tax=Nocardiopsis changdeensis TaxID=2831969 RepID=A0ABX8BE96_9ACTN|nr:MULTISPECIES: YaaC family protein [Nocardiopsis]QUX20570.1 hypothetical protein KGD84_18875 [Nocardiopsis changdeensis]QYX36501.1 YaaC family protein [Nocardiopsis sp. MT53]
MHFNDSAWARLRATRANPPAPTAKPKPRKVTYQFGLEQAEQLFRQAADAAPATRPITVFYGLSQAGRAIAAAASNAQDKWELVGHGISPRNDTLRDPLPDVQIRTDGPENRGSFTRLSKILGSPVWGDTAVPLEKLWDCIPETGEWLFGEPSTDRRTPLQIEIRDVPEQEQDVVQVPAWPLPPWVITTTDHQTLHDYLAVFPDAAGYDFAKTGPGPDADPAYEPHVDGSGEVYLRWNADLGRKYTERIALLHGKSRLYQGGRYLFPAPPGADRGMHPLMAWWAILHTLSMLARYHPVEWARHIDVDASPYAVPIEELLRVSLGVLPELILEAIDDVQA